MSAYTYTCLCGLTSQRFGSKKAMYAWHSVHKQKECTAVRRSSPTAASPFSATVGRARIDAELEARIATVRRLRPIPIDAVPTPSPRPAQWTDASTDRWGARRKGLARQWENAQCLQASIASVMGAADIAKVPDPTASYYAEPADWHNHYNARLVKATGYRLEFLEAHAIPPKNLSQLWIAGISSDGDRDGHAVVARGAYVYHDPAGIYLGRLPLHRVNLGMIIRSTRRVVPVFHGRHAIGAA
jgi:hypothetical protein